MDNRIIFYDFETFLYNWLVVCIDYETKDKTVIIDSVKDLKIYYENHKNDIWIGFNSRNFDQFILKGLLLGKNAYDLTQKLIVEGKKGFQILRSANTIKLNNFDVAVGFRSLKELEGFMGSMIKESSVPFDIQRPLTEDEITETIVYCTHDVLQTIEVFERRKEEFTSQLGLIEAFNLKMTEFNKTKAQLSAHILGTIKQESIDDEFNFIIPKTLRLSKYKYVLDWYRNPRNWTYARKLETIIAGIPHVFGYGGIHGAIPNCVEEGIILCMDINSMYPATMINYNFLSRNVINPKKFREIRDTRMDLKRKKDKKQQPYKIVLNSTFGASKDRNNPLYDPAMCNNVCIAGQLLILDLIEKIEHMGKILQSNTDGIYIKVDSLEVVEQVKTIAKEWEDRTQYSLDFELATRLIQKDVNNYLIVHPDGTYKSKGGYVKELSDIDNDLPIVNKSLIDYFMKDIPVEQTITECDKLIEFQKVVKVTSLYKYALHGETKITEKVLRVFASNDENAPGIFKYKGVDKIEKIANTPDKCFINNENIVGVKVPEYLDKQYYIDIAKDRIVKFIEVDEVEEKVTPEQQLLEILNKKLFHFYDVMVEIDNANIGVSVLTKFIRIDVFKEYGKVNKILKYVEYFKALNGKKSPKKPTLDKTINSEEIFMIIEKHSEFDHGEKVNKKTGKVEIKVPTYKNLDSEKALKEIWNIVPDTDIPTVDKLRQEYDLYNEVSIVDSSVPSSDLFILAVNETKNPTIIAYCINNGSIQFLKVNKNLFNILEIRQRDLINAYEFELKTCKKVVGKDNNGVNVLKDDITRKEWWLVKYDIADRDYSKNEKTIEDLEEDNINLI